MTEGTSTPTLSGVCARELAAMTSIIRMVHGSVAHIFSCLTSGKGGQSIWKAIQTLMCSGCVSDMPGNPSLCEYEASYRYQHLQSNKKRLEFTCIITRTEISVQTSFWRYPTIPKAEPPPPGSGG